MHLVRQLKLSKLYFVIFLFFSKNSLYQYILIDMWYACCHMFWLEGNADT